ncbi:hypothetical protein J4E93_006003 [Alternaria ventricosa]|uniref:uncharacterized protein n=1 Tax=Alternaria ventricosa TaxID=1187951 RepID=UPI0020C484D9|nr:uncharacterized protein J4E93_006003 [Alternaria ventricosa]KAI4645203.1 hypothetical protein J4E93_006003 [Alternaria ventricosa]
MSSDPPPSFKSSITTDTNPPPLGERNPSWTPDELAANYDFLWKLYLEITKANSDAILNVLKQRDPVAIQKEAQEMKINQMQGMLQLQGLYKSAEETKQLEAKNKEQENRISELEASGKEYKAKLEERKES